MNRGVHEVIHGERRIGGLTNTVAQVALIAHLMAWRNVGWSKWQEAGFPPLPSGLLTLIGQTIRKAPTIVTQIDLRVGQPTKRSTKRLRSTGCQDVTKPGIVEVQGSITDGARRRFF